MNNETKRATQIAKCGKVHATRSFMAHCITHTYYMYFMGSFSQTFLRHSHIHMHNLSARIRFGRRLRSTDITTMPHKKSLCTPCNQRNFYVWPTVEQIGNFSLLYCYAKNWQKRSSSSSQIMFCVLSLVCVLSAMCSRLDPDIGGGIEEEIVCTFCQLNTRTRSRQFAAYQHIDHHYSFLACKYILWCASNVQKLRRQPLCMCHKQFCDATNDVFPVFNFIYFVYSSQFDKVVILRDA